jgi:hypothetical protein
LPWYGRSSTGLVCCVVFAVAACRLAWGDPRLRQWFVPVVTTAVAWFSLAYTAGLRSNGLDFDFAIQWFPGDLHFRFWPAIAVATLVKALLAPVLVVLGVQRFCGPIDRRAIAPMVYIRLAGIAAGLAGLLVQSASAPRYWVIEQVEDMVAWLLVLGVVLVAGWRAPYRRKVRAGRRGWHSGGSTGAGAGLRADRSRSDSGGPLSRLGLGCRRDLTGSECRFFRADHGQMSRASAQLAPHPSGVVPAPR